MFRLGGKYQSYASCKLSLQKHVRIKTICQTHFPNSRPFLTNLELNRSTTIPKYAITNRNHREYLQHNRFFSTEKKSVIKKAVKGKKNDEKPSTKIQSIEDQYTRKTPLEHILLRPGMYIGPAERSLYSCWILKSSELSNYGSPRVKSEFDVDKMRMFYAEKNIIPALQKIFDEILVNASDNHLRHPKSCDKIDVIIDPGGKDRDPFISVRNNGKGIPVQIHRKEKLYIPEMLFGHLLTGSNFDDDSKRITGGRHGYGAKLTNIFSKTFTVETADTTKNLKYIQTWTNNMSESSEPQIEKITSNDNSYTQVSFTPDLARLTGQPLDINSQTTNNKIHKISKDDYELMCRRVFDIAGCTGSNLNVTLNGSKIPISNFQSYCKLFTTLSDSGSKSKTKSKPICFHKISPRFEVGVALSDTGSFESVSFVNGMATPRGGTHVNIISQQITQYLSEKIKKMHPDVFKDISQRQLQNLVRRNLMVFCNTLIENPSFDSQMKESLTSSPSTFGSKFTLSNAFLGRLTREMRIGDDGEVDCSPNSTGGGPGILEEVIRVVKGHMQASLLKDVGGGKKNKRQILSIPKLDDAQLAGSRNDALKCTLILTEGDSAKALAIAGLSVIGREKYGVFPLRGKFLNVRDASISQLTKNQELISLCAIIGLDFDKKYSTIEERSTLRYGQVMLMTDQDADGSHIKGLIMNFFRHFWPSLLKPIEDHDSKNFEHRPFLSSFVTPLLKATSKSKKEVKSFYSLAEYDHWRKSIENSNDLKNWNIKYYKGLGTSTPVEAKAYFSAFEQHRRLYEWHSDQDGEQLDMVFEKSRASDRRNWILKKYNESSNLLLNHSKSVSYEDFVDKELVQFSNADNVRSLPSVIDGLKPSQRKVLFACFKRNLKNEIKVAQLAGYCAEHTSYHHGEASLHATIIGMAQDFIGANNINLLEPVGQFGTRLNGGKDAASPRYIFTKLNPITRKIFPEIDDKLLKQKFDDGQAIEPQYFCPIIPLLLVNGSQGIGTGWSTSIPPHNPNDVTQYIKAKLIGEDTLPDIQPWVRGFNGEIVKRDDETGYQSIGGIKKSSRTSLTIYELPIFRWTNDYKGFLLRMRDAAEIQSFVENHTTDSVSFTITLKSVRLERMIKSGLHKVFRLEASLPNTNMHAFDSGGVIKKFNSPQDLVEEFFPIRLALYNERKSSMERAMKYKVLLLKNKCRFLNDVSDGKIDIVKKRRSKEEAENILRELHFHKKSSLDAILEKDICDDGAIFPEEEKNEESELQSSKEYDYLLNLPLSSFTKEKVQTLNSESIQIENQLEKLQNTSAEQLWLADLNELEPYLKKILNS